jgi:hypothetical protein
MIQRLHQPSLPYRHYPKKLPDPDDTKAEQEQSNSIENDAPLKDVME